jgi:hypothetical protein
VRRGRGRKEDKEKKGRERRRERKTVGEKGKWSNRGLSEWVFGQNGRLR